MIPRRAFLAGGGACLALATTASAKDGKDEARLSVGGSREQGSLVVGKCASLPDMLKVDGRELRVAPTGVFAFGLAYDQVRMSDIEAQFHDDYVEHLGVVPVARKYDIQRINGLPQKFVTPPAEVIARIARENAMVGETRKRDTDSIAFAAPFDWPAKGIISGTFGSQRIDNGTPMAPHFGVDIAAPKGTPIHAPADGVVSLAQSDFYLTGGTTVLDHGHGVSTTYIHQDEVKVKVGDAVKRGDPIGLVGMKGRATGPHLHWGMNWFQVRLDPSRSTATPAPAKA